MGRRPPRQIRFPEKLERDLEDFAERSERTFNASVILACELLVEKGCVTRYYKKK